jgi:hypothetical protein
MGGQRTTNLKQLFSFQYFYLKTAYVTQDLVESNYIHHVTRLLGCILLVV